MSGRRSSVQIAWLAVFAFGWGAAVSGSSAQDAVADVAPAETAPESTEPTESGPTAAEGATRAQAADTTSPRAAAGPRTAPREAPLPWTGPRVQLGYRIYSLSDSAGGGAVNSATFSGFLPTRFLRAGGGLEAGGRAYEYGQNDGLFSGNAFAGYQHLRDLGRVVPYVVALGELGFLLGKRFHTPVARLVRGAGVEIGADVNIVRSFYLGLGIGYMVYSIDGLAYDTFGLRLSVGL